MESRIFTASLKGPSTQSLFKWASIPFALVKETLDLEMDLRFLGWYSNWAVLALKEGTDGGGFDLLGMMRYLSIVGLVGRAMNSMRRTEMSENEDCERKKKSH